MLEVKPYGKRNKLEEKVNSFLDKFESEFKNKFDASEYFQEAENMKQKQIDTLAKKVCDFCRKNDSSFDGITVHTNSKHRGILIETKHK